MLFQWIRKKMTPASQPNLPQIAKQYLERMTTRISNDVLRSIAGKVVYDLRFQTGVGSSVSENHPSHHAYVGGLMVHTAEVVTVAMATARSMKIDFDVLLTAAIVHDYMKIYDYVIGANNQIQKTEYRKLVRHLAGSHAWFYSEAIQFKEMQLPSDLRLQVEHAILAHHGRLEWQTAVEPVTPEAHILHYADMLSANFGSTSATQFGQITLTPYTG